MTYLKSESRKINARTIIISAIAFTIMFLISLLSVWLFPDHTYILLLPIFLTLLIGLQIEIYYRNQRFLQEQTALITAALSSYQYRQEKDYQQLEALFSVFSLIRPTCPLPDMRGWAISPDFAKPLITLIYEHRPSLVVETGSGISTLITGYCLKSLEHGRIISLDHEANYAQVSAERVMHHGLSDIATVLHAPLKDMRMGNQAQTWQWYDTYELFAKLQQKIDLLVIDGPPGDLQPLSRYPALPILFERLSDRAIIVMDDASREDEQKIIERWQQEFNCVLVSMIANEKGAAILRIQK